MDQPAKRKQALRGCKLPGIAGREFDRRSNLPAGQAGRERSRPIAAGFPDPLPPAGETPSCLKESVFQMAEVAVPRGLFRAILERVRRLRLPDAVPR